MATNLSSDYPRFVVERVRDALSDTPVVAINGARQVGKSTLVQGLVARAGGGRITTLDDPTQREAARTDPTTFVQQDGLLVIDEVQRVPELLPAMKAEVDRDRRPGRFLLTGSARLLSTAELSASLAGRVDLIDLFPLSQGELERKKEKFIDALFAWDKSLFVGSSLRRTDYLQRVCLGGYPEPISRSGARRHAWFRNYATTVLERMVADIADVERLSAMPRLLKLCAARTAGELNVVDLATILGVPYRTVGAYLTHLQTVFLLHLLPAWSNNLSSKVSRRPKLMVTDSGLAADLVGATPASLEDPTSATGALFETFVAMEVRKQLGWSSIDAELFHFRDRGGTEVDLVLESRAGQVAAIEVKASATAAEKDFRGLRFLKERLGKRFVGGVVLYSGKDAVRFGDRLAALPLSALWSRSR